MGYGYYGYRPYVTVAERQRRAKREMARLEKKGLVIQPVAIPGRKIATTFWGQAWCDHLESFSDFANRLPRGRTYVRNGSVCHLAITQGQVEAKVSGSELYNVQVKIATLPQKKWAKLKKQCTGQIGSLLELLSGQLSESIMRVVTDRDQGLFPLPREITFDCDCPDWATMCKHVAAVLYGVGSRLDHQPGLLFELRGVDVEELIQADAENALDTSLKTADGKHLANEDLSDIFGIDLTEPAGKLPPKSKKIPAKKRQSASRGSAKSSKSAKKKTPAKKRAAKASSKKKKKAKASTKKKTSTAKKKSKASEKKKKGNSTSTRKKS